jgi:hypothetical protein
MKKAQYRKYKEVYQIDLDILKQIIKNCDAQINKINTEIDKQNKKLKGGNIIRIKYIIYYTYLKKYSKFAYTICIKRNIII